MTNPELLSAKDKLEGPLACPCVGPGVTALIFSGCSDIQDFTATVHDSSPMEMVIFLNSLYKMFDARIDKYDVYKVQAINDSFMLASGIPTQVKAKV